MRHVPLAAPAIVLVILASGCPWSQSKKVAPEPQQVAAVGINPGQIAPDLESQDQSGERFHVADYKGKVVVMHFWANW